MKGIFLLIIAALLFPIYWMVVGSLMDLHGIYRIPPMLWPKNPSLSNYVLLLRGTLLASWIFNTCLLAAAIVIASTASAAMAGYAFSTQKGLGWLYVAFLGAMMIPRSALIIPTFVIVKRLGMSGTIAAAALPVIFFPVGILLVKNYIDGMPSSILDAAKMDGAGDWKIISWVIAPLSMPVLTALAVIKFIEALTDYLWQMLVLQESSRQTLIVGLLVRVMNPGATQEMRINPIGIEMAAGVILFLPLLAIFFAFRKSFIDGIMGGSLKE